METSEQSPPQTSQLPCRLREAFQALRKGRHVCRSDGPMWFDLRDNTDRYREIFAALGYTLSEHPRGFYYFSEGHQTRSDLLTRLVYFFACFFADLDQGRIESRQTRWVDSLTNHDFDLPTLIQNMFAANDRQRVFDQLGVAREGFDKAIIAPLIRYGIASRTGTGQLRFREPVYRFVELFQSCGADDMAASPEPIAALEQDDDDRDEDEDGEGRQ